MSTNLTKPTFGQRVIRAGRSNSNLSLVSSLGMGLLRAAGRCTSAFKRYDVLYTPGARPLTPVRHAMNGARLLLPAFNVAATTYQLKARTTGSENRYGVYLATTSNLTDQVVTGTLSVLLIARRLTTGASLVRKHPLSGFGRTSTAFELVHMSLKTASAARELHARRDEWLPELQEFCADVAFSLKSTRVRVVRTLQVPPPSGRLLDDEMSRQRVREAMNYRPN